MSKKAIWIIVIVIVMVIVALWWWNAGRAPAPQTTSEAPAASLAAAVETVDVGSLDAEFQAIDKDLGQL